MSVQSRTPNFGFARITPNSIGWAGDVNDNATLIDAVLNTYLQIANVRGPFAVSTLVSVDDVYIDTTTALLYKVLIGYTTGTGTFAQDRTANPTKWEEVVAYTPTIPNEKYNNVLHNSAFRVNQRGVGPWTGDGDYTSDRWRVFNTLGTSSTTVVSLSDADRALMVDENAIYGLQVVFAGGAAAGANSHCSQRMESARVVSGKTVTVSFWAKATSGTPMIGVEIAKSFGTGGSPSTFETLNGSVASVALTTAMTYYEFTFAVASAQGKTFGSNADDYTQLLLWLSAGASYNTRSGGIGVQSGTVVISKVKLQANNEATPYIYEDNEIAVAQCQRFYSVLTAVSAGYNAAGASTGDWYEFPVTMRAVPTVTLVGPSTINGGTETLSGTNTLGTFYNVVITALGPYSTSATITASADL
jgi:hypothetical protein